jgi:hypothetical protein
VQPTRALRALVGGHSEPVWFPSLLWFRFERRARRLTRDVGPPIATVFSNGFQMLDIKRNIEQLEEAGYQIDKRTPTAARLGLLLVDNLAELLMYNRVRLEFARDSQLGRVTQPKYSSSKRKEVTEYFDKKVNFVVSETKDIQEDDGEVLKVGHQLRNEAYHKGILRESIIGNVTATYFEVVCKVLPQFWSGWLAYSHPDEVTRFLQRFDIQGSTIDWDILGKVCGFLLKGRACTISSLCESLSDDLVHRIQETWEGLAYLASNSHEPSTPENTLKEMQVFKKLEADYSFPQTNKGGRDFWKTYKELMRSYKPPISPNTFEGWKRRAISLKSETMSGKAMRKFADIDRVLLPIEMEVSEAVFQFDEMINAQIHDR